ncbi:hypothetical protein [Celerinatantimonas sp. YJH-8]|uniref:hypothetical protein n=1 Tax=Celerinatantimonas sp. YJH-8 TaxID=3228714 RepID=UPI0038C2EEFD
MKMFFQNSHCLDNIVFKCLRRVKPNWLVIWDEQRHQYRDEPFSFAVEFNFLLEKLELIPYQLQLTEAHIELLKFLNCNKVPQDTMDLNKFYIELLKKGFYADIEGSDLIELIAILIYRLRSVGYQHVDEVNREEQNRLGILICLVLFDWYRLIGSEPFHCDHTKSSIHW